MTKRPSGPCREGLSQSVEDYLREMWLIEERGERITTHALAVRLNVASPSVTQMVRRLSKLGLVTCEPYGPTCLTDTGRCAASDVASRYELANLFLTTVLGYTTEVARPEADRLEHALSPKLQSRLAACIHKPRRV